jgi:hypothetical protein
MAKSDFKKPQVSEISLDIETVAEKPKETDLQRTEKWMLDRMGRWTGSQQKNLMTCSSSGGKLSWYDVDKLFHPGTSVLKYIYENAMERLTGKYTEMGAGTKEMQYGTRVEPLIAKSAKKWMKKNGIKGKLKDVGFKQFPTMPQAGVSSDNILVLKKQYKKSTSKANKKRKAVPVATVEYKACTNFGTHYERTFEATDEKSKDFWQTQGQMIAWEVDKCYYVVAQPPININKYLYYDGDIMDLYDEFKKECPITVEVIKSSKTHQQALLKRIAIAESVLVLWLKDTTKNLRELLYKQVDYFKNNQEELNIYIDEKQ